MSVDSAADDRAASDDRGSRVAAGPAAHRSLQCRAVPAGRPEPISGSVGTSASGFVSSTVVLAGDWRRVASRRPQLRRGKKALPAHGEAKRTARTRHTSRDVPTFIYRLMHRSLTSTGRPSVSASASATAVRVCGQRMTAHRPRYGRKPSARSSERQRTRRAEPVASALTCSAMAMCGCLCGGQPTDIGFKRSAQALQSHECGLWSGPCGTVMASMATQFQSGMMDLLR